MKNMVWWVFMSIVALHCSQPKKNKNRDSLAVAESDDDRVLHATGFDILNDQVIVQEPWPGATKPLSYKTEKKLERVICMSTTHLPYIEMLGESESVVGFPNTDFISSKQFRALVDAGKITDVGNGGALNTELVIALNPDAVFIFDAGAESMNLDKLKESGIRTIYNSDFMETSALGKAEWIKFFGAFFHKPDLADSIFQTIQTRYDSLLDITKTIVNRPTVMSGTLYGDVWFLPGGENSFADFILNAGGDYLWRKSPSNGWMELSFESVFEKAREADFWIGVGSFRSLQELAAQDERYQNFHSFSNRRVYSYVKKTGETGGIDFFESGYARPDLVLADMVKIFHPELLPEYKTTYFMNIQ